MTVTVAGGDDWQADVAEGVREWRLNYACPTCNMAQAVTLQPTPWSVPAEQPTPDKVRAGVVKHRDVDELATQLWCHRCGKGVDVTVSRTT